jgi:RsiW-degrading membrane proteinase PrsW (M82 family)
MVLYGTLGLCAVLAALLVVRYDLHDREPPVLLAATVAWGAFLMWSLGYVETFVIDDLIGRSDVVVVAGVAAAFEEGAKLTAVLGVALLAREHFNDPVDGLVYGSMAGLGAALEESVFLLSLFPPDGPWLPAGEVVRLAGHLIMGGIGGFGLGPWRCGHPRRAAILAGTWLLAVAVHFGWDVLALLPGPGDGARIPGGMAVMLSGMVVFGILVARGSHMSARVFAPGQETSLWGWPFSRRRPGRDGSRTP